MSKYNALWEYVSQSGRDRLVLSYEEIEQAGGVPIDHSFLNFKKELTDFGYKVGKISMKAQTVTFEKIESQCK